MAGAGWSILLYHIYRGGGAALFWAGLPFLTLYRRHTGRYGDRFPERMGRVVAPEAFRRSPVRIWFHAVSLGEVKVARSLVQALEKGLPEAACMVSTFTEHGRRAAEEALGDIPRVYAPLDTGLFVRRALRALRPHVMVFLETELWPCWIVEARAMGIPTALLNGRVSPRSIGGYRRLRPFFRYVLEHLDVLGMIREEDAGRIRSMGAPPERVRVVGNAKYDLLKAQTDPGIPEALSRIYGVAPGQGVFVAGSTREGEEALVLQAYGRVLARHPDTLLVLVPRHIERSQEIRGLVEGHGLSCRMRTDLGPGRPRRTEQVVVVDCFGELFKVYSLATLAFCGASLVPLGGQNPLEPAVWGSPVLYGPSMEDFLDARALLEEQGGGILVANGEELGIKVLWLLENREEALRLGRLARRAVEANQGAAERYAEIVKDLVTKGNRGGRGAPGPSRRPGGKERP